MCIQTNASSPDSSKTSSSSSPSFHTAPTKLSRVSDADDEAPKHAENNTSEDAASVDGTSEDAAECETERKKEKKGEKEERKRGMGWF